MATYLEIDQVLQQMPERVLVDVRTPAEYARGHVPGAVNLPLFSDDERAEVGTIYKQQSPEKAMIRGLQIAGPKLAGFVKQARKIAPGRKISVHCWRGGKRSYSMAWLLELSGFDTVILQGGYKAYRQHILKKLVTADKLIVLGGRTGCGKTHILHALEGRGEQIIDLERLANHKGSSFGMIGQPPQPSIEQFENDLYAAWSTLNHQRRIWVENESRSIGMVFIPDPFWKQMKAAPLINLNLPFETRVERLVSDYASQDPMELRAAFERIHKRIGGQNVKQALDAINLKDYRTAAAIALYYYDKTYQYGLDNNPSPSIHHLDIADQSFELSARHLVEYADQQGW